MAASMEYITAQSIKQEAVLSRSTSAGSYSSNDQYSSEAEPLTSGLPEYEYPAPFIVRNGFIDTEEVPSMSLIEFFEERRIQSCPLAAQEQNLQSAASCSSAHELQTPECSPMHHRLYAGTRAVPSFNAVREDSTLGSPLQSMHDDDEDASNLQLQTEPPRVLVLADALDMPETEPIECDVSSDSNELPSLGSAGHFSGECKPCAFLYTKGCGNGLQCHFCHLCPPDEKHRRQKEKVIAFREMRRQRKLSRRC